MSQNNEATTPAAEGNDAMTERRNNIKDLLAIMDEGELSAIRYKDATCEIELERKVVSGASLPMMAERVGQLLNARADAAGITTGGEPAPAEDEDQIVRAPMIGTFYVAPSPDEDPFVQVGQEVLSGQTLAIVEAMKMMNEITAPVPGVITEVLAANGSQVEYDQPLFRISTSLDA